MKTLIVILFSIFLFLSAVANNQISVNEHTTVHMICPMAVGYIQVGNPQVLMAEVVADYPNIIRVKATESFKNIGSITLVCDDQLYAFQVKYSSSCPLQLKLNSFQGEPLLGNTGAYLPVDKILQLKEKMRGAKARRFIKKVRANDILFTLTDIRVKQGLLFVRLSIENRSNLIYRTHVPTFLMRDKKPRKAANVQEYLIEPLHPMERELFIAPDDKVTVVLVLESFTVPDHKEVEIKLREKTKGYTGRDLKLCFTHKAIVTAKSL